MSRKSTKSKANHIPRKTTPQVVDYALSLYEEAKAFHHDRQYLDAAQKYIEASDQLYSVRSAAQAHGAIANLMEEAGLCLKKLPGMEEAAKECFQTSSQYKAAALQVEFSKQAKKLVKAPEPDVTELTARRRHTAANGHAKANGHTEVNGNRGNGVRVRNFYPSILGSDVKAVVMRDRPKLGGIEPTFMQQARWVMFPNARPVILLEMAGRPVPVSGPVVAAAAAVTNSAAAGPGS